MEREGAVFGRYRLRERLGHGGMGEVYVAYDTHKDCDVAIKRLRHEYAEDHDFQARFRREAQLAARLRDPHVIPIHDYGEIDGQLYIEMRLVDGVDLERVLHDGPVDPHEALDILAQVAAALDAAHAAGLVHRDVKPSNVVLTGKPGHYFAYLVDFGVARPLLGHGGSKITATVGTVGTLAYLAPERIDGMTGDRRADVYSLACVLFECLTRRCPFSGEPVSVMFAHVHKPVPKATELAPWLPPEIDYVIARGMAKRPEDRYDSAGELVAAARAALGTASAATVVQTPLPAPTPPPTPPPTPAPPPPAGAARSSGEQQVRVRSAAGTVLGGIALVLAFTVLPWYYSGSNAFFRSASGRTSFGQLHDDITQLEHTPVDTPIDFGVSKVYFGGLAWALFGLAVVLGLVTAAPIGRWAAWTRAGGALVAGVGLALTLWAVAPFRWNHSTSSYIRGYDSPSYLTWVGHASFGFWFAVAGFALVGLATWFGPPRHRASAG